MAQTNWIGLAGVLWLPLLITAVEAYFLGCFNGAVIVSKYILRDDVRNHGSGNAGLTNFYRTFGGPLTAVVISCDVLKAMAALLLGSFISGLFSVPFFSPIYARYWAGLFCLLGHMFPCMFHFKGGKGILSGGTIAIMLDWRIALLVWGGFIVLVALTRYVSLGSLWAAGSFPFGTWLVFGDPILIVMGFLMGGLVVWMHRANVKRLLTGTESKFSFRKKK